MYITFGYIPTNATLEDILQFLDDNDGTRLLGIQLRQRIMEEYPDNSEEMERLQERVDQLEDTLDEIRSLV